MAKEAIDNCQAAASNDLSKPVGVVFRRELNLLDCSVGDHCVGDFDEASDVGAFNVVHVVALFSELNASCMDLFHDRLKL